MKMYTLLFLICFFEGILTFKSVGLYAFEKSDNSKCIINVEKLNVVPFLDGASLDSCWQKLKEYNLGVSNKDKGGGLYFQVCRSKGKIFFKLNFHAKSRRDTYQCWHWDPVIQAYTLGEEEEETICIIISNKSSRLSDVWVWRSARTNPVGTLDDLYMGDGKKIIPDSGQLSWYGRFFGNYAGVVLPRFYNRVPVGSVADVTAVGIWRNNTYTIEIARKMNTGNSDDLIFKSGDEYFIQIFRYVPNLKELKYREAKFILKIE
jgi:hypothetical protein